MTVISIDDLRAIRERHRADERYEATRLHIDPGTLAFLQAYVYKIHGADQLEQLLKLEPGRCNDCEKDYITDHHDMRWFYGKLELCRDHVLPRLRVHNKLNPKPETANG